MKMIYVPLISGEVKAVGLKNITQYIIYEKVIHIFTRNIQVDVPKTKELVETLIQNKYSINYN